jgi:hypothetical protein
MVQRRENDFKTSVSLPEIVQREVGTNSFEEVALQAKTLDGHAFTFNESNDLTDTPPLMTIIRLSLIVFPLHRKLAISCSLKDTDFGRFSPYSKLITRVRIAQSV